MKLVVFVDTPLEEEQGEQANAIVNDRGLRSMLSSYTYRVPRSDCALKVEFLVGTDHLFGTTDNVSESGLLVNFGEPQLVGTSGELRFSVGRCCLAVMARVTHAKGFVSGLEFCFSSERERAFVRAAMLELTRGVSGS